MRLKTDTIQLQYTLYHFHYFITTCLSTVEIYQEMFQSNSFNGNDLKPLFNWGWSHLINKLSLTRNLNLWPQLNITIKSFLLKLFDSKLKFCRQEKVPLVEVLKKY